LNEEFAFGQEKSPDDFPSMHDKVD